MTKIEINKKIKELKKQIQTLENIKKNDKPPQTELVLMIDETAKLVKGEDYKIPIPGFDGKLYIECNMYWETDNCPSVSVGDLGIKKSRQTDIEKKLLTFVNTTDSYDHESFKEDIVNSSKEYKAFHKKIKVVCKTSYAFDAKYSSFDWVNDVLVPAEQQVLR